LLLKKFVNDPANFVKEMFEGIYLANKDKLKWVPEYNILYRADLPKDKVVVMQGSGSGHEPAHSMVVGPGMLDACCPGNIFAAPPMDYVYECTKLIANDKGVLHLINNYQGDRMAWDMAREMAEADGIKIGVVIIDDDVSVTNSLYTVGRRGVAGNFFVIKAVGAAAAKGKSLEELVALGEKVNKNVRSMGIALSSCTPPAKGAPIFDIGDDEIEIGIGIHGEPGRRRDKIRSASEIIEEVFTAVHDDIPFQKGDRVAIMVNGMGGTPISELYLLYGLAAKKAEAKGLTIVKNYVGNYCTSLEMQGFSLTLLKLDSEIESLLNEPAEIPIRVF
jgi:dihydroxyacetone kinase-like protein